MIKLVIPDLVSNSYLPAVAAVELGFFKKEGLDAEVELIYPVDACYRALREGRAHFVGGSAHSAPSAFPEWRGVKLLAALAQGMYWFLVLRADIGAKRGDVSAVRGRRIGAAPMVDLGLKRLLIEAGIDLGRDEVTIAPVPGMAGSGISFGVNAAKALEEGKIDGFWANGMGAEVAVRRGVGTVVLDVRRGDGPKGCFHYTCPVLATTAELLAREPETAAAAVRAVVNVQQALKADVSLATEVGRKLFPPFEAALIADVVARDLPYYDATISPDFFRNMTRFVVEVGLSSQEPAYPEVVATEFDRLWKA
jgi:ABC-type nitrate/sulfonate/bicarbonate transport system substrate-binding protein